MSEIIWYLALQGTVWFYLSYCCVVFCLYLYYNFLIFSLVVEHLDCFHMLVILPGAVGTMGVHITFQIDG